MALQDAISYIELYYESILYCVITQKICNILKSHTPSSIAKSSSVWYHVPT